MITAIDTNILIDIFGADKKYGRASLEALKQCAVKGSLIACDVVWVETATAFSNSDQCRYAMEKISVEFSPISYNAIWIAAEAWRNYRQGGGKRDRVAADFLIAAHALSQSKRLITRDRGFYRQYFSELNIIDPTGKN